MKIETTFKAFENVLHATLFASGTCLVLSGTDLLPEGFSQTIDPKEVAGIFIRTLSFEGANMCRSLFFSDFFLGRNGPTFIFNRVSLATSCLAFLGAGISPQFFGDHAFKLAIFSSLGALISTSCMLRPPAAPPAAAAAAPPIPAREDDPQEESVCGKLEVLLYHHLDFIRMLIDGYLLEIPEIPVDRLVRPQIQFQRNAKADHLFDTLDLSPLFEEWIEFHEKVMLFAEEELAQSWDEAQMKAKARLVNEFYYLAYFTCSLAYCAGRKQEKAEETRQLAEMSCSVALALFSCLGKLCNSFEIKINPGLVGQAVMLSELGMLASPNFESNPFFPLYLKIRREEEIDDSEFVRIISDAEQRVQKCLRTNRFEEFTPLLRRYLTIMNRIHDKALSNGAADSGARLKSARVTTSRETR